MFLFDKGVCIGNHCIICHTRNTPTTLFDTIRLPLSFKIRSQALGQSYHVIVPRTAKRPRRTRVNWPVAKKARTVTPGKIYPSFMLLSDNMSHQNSSINTYIWRRWHEKCCPRIIQTYVTKNLSIDIPCKSNTNGFSDAILCRLLYRISRGCVRLMQPRR